LSAALCVQVAEQVMLATQTQLGVINTAYIERLQATLRGWLPMAFRRTRCPARSADRVEDALFWTGVVYNL
jgi:IS1 family transposase